MSKVRDNALTFEAVKVAITQDKDGFMLKLRVHPDDMPEDLFRAWVGSRYSCAVVQIDDDEQPVVPKAKSESQRLVQSAVMLCERREFWAWMEKTYADPGDTVESSEEAAQLLRDALMIESRSEIGSNKKVMEEFRKIVHDFERDMSKPRRE